MKSSATVAARVPSTLIATLNTAAIWTAPVQRSVVGNMTQPLWLQGEGGLTYRGEARQLMCCARRSSGNETAGTCRHLMRDAWRF